MMATYYICNPKSGILSDKHDGEENEICKNERCNYTVADCIAVHGPVDNAVYNGETMLKQVLLRRYVPVDELIENDKRRKREGKPMLFQMLKNLEQLMVTHGSQWDKGDELGKWKYRDIVKGMNRDSKLLRWHWEDKKLHSTLTIPMDVAQMIKWSTIQDIMASVKCSDDELISALANYHCITDVTGEDWHRPGPKVTRLKRRLSFAMIVETKTTYRPSGWTNKQTRT